METIPSEFWSQVLAFAQSLGRRVGTQLLHEAQHQVFAHEKTDGSLVTAWDEWADQEIREAITASFPSHGLLTEEDDQRFAGQEWYWVLDPIDGTTNFARGIPLWGISLALLYQGMPVFGYLNFPSVNQVFYGFTKATGQGGAYLNGEALHPSLAILGANQCFSVCSRTLPSIKHPFPAKIRMLGSAAYNLLSVASGSMVGAVEATPKVWDLAAVWVLVETSGAVWVALNGKHPFPLVAGTDYEKIPFPTMVVSRAEWQEIFEPLVQGILC